MELDSSAIFKKAMFQSNGSGCWRKIQIALGSERNKINSIEFLNVRKIPSIEVFHKHDSQSHNTCVAPALLPVLAFSRRILWHRQECLCHIFGGASRENKFS